MNALDFQVGEVVNISTGSGPIMTVIEIVDRWFRCAWEDREGRYHEGIFDAIWLERRKPAEAAQLPHRETSASLRRSGNGTIIAVRPVVDFRLEVGASVRLITGGPVMTVHRVVAGSCKCICAWQDARGVKRKALVDGRWLERCDEPQLRS